MDNGPCLEVVVSSSLVISHSLASKDQSLLSGGDAFLLLDSFLEALHSCDESPTQKTNRGETQRELHGDEKVLSVDSMSIVAFLPERSLTVICMNR